MLNNNNNEGYNPGYAAATAQQQQPPMFAPATYTQPATYAQLPMMYGQPQAQPQVLYIYAPQGCYPVPGNPGLLAVPNGAAVPSQASQQQVFSTGTNLTNFAPMAVMAPPPAVNKKARGLAIAALVTFLVGYFTYVCYLASVIISLHMVRKGYIVKKRSHVIAFAILELIAWAFVASFSWYYEIDCYSTNGYYSGGYEYYGNMYCYTMWWGWISLIVWGVFALAFGIPRVIFTYLYDGRQSVTAPAPAPVVMATFSTYA